MLVKKPVVSRKHYAIGMNKPAGYPNWIFIFFLTSGPNSLIETKLLFKLWQFQMCLISITCHDRRTCRRWRALQMLENSFFFAFSPPNNLKWFEARFLFIFMGKPFSNVFTSISIWASACDDQFLLCNEISIHEEVVFQCYSWALHKTHRF